MEPITAMLFLSLFHMNNKEFFDTATEQSKNGFTWEQIECRKADPTLPAITIINPVTGEEIVCNKLTK
jgi:hypothetical protein